MRCSGLKPLSCPFSTRCPGALPSRFFKHGISLPGRGESLLGRPADFHMGKDGRILACKYGRHAYDQWTVDDVLK
jgi:hypothetical protein